MIVQAFRQTWQTAGGVIYTYVVIVRTIYFVKRYEFKTEFEQIAFLGGLKG